MLDINQLMDVPVKNYRNTNSNNLFYKKSQIKHILILTDTLKEPIIFIKEGYQPLFKLKGE